VVPNFFQFSMILIGSFLLSGCNQYPDSEYPDSQYQCEGELNTIYKDGTSSIKRVDHPVFFQIKNDKISLSGIADISVENQKTCPSKISMIDADRLDRDDEIRYFDHNCEGKTLAISFSSVEMILRVRIYPGERNLFPQELFLLNCKRLGQSIKN